MPYKNKEDQLRNMNKWRHKEKDIQSLENEMANVPFYVMELLMLKWTLNEMQEGREVTITEHLQKEREIKTQTGFDGSLEWAKSVFNY